MEKWNVAVFTSNYKEDKANSKIMEFKDQAAAADFCQNLSIYMGEVIRMAWKSYDGNGHYFRPERTI